MRGLQRIGPHALSGGNDAGAVNLAACTGECDSDAQCAAGLLCFQREYNEIIPGCRAEGLTGTTATTRCQGDEVGAGGRCAPTAAVDQSRVLGAAVCCARCGCLSFGACQNLWACMRRQTWRRSPYTSRKGGASEPAGRSGRSGVLGVSTPRFSVPVIHRCEHICSFFEQGS